MKEITPPAPNGGTIPDPRIPPEIQGAVQVTTLDKLLDSVYNWGRKRSLWPMAFGLACCAIEMIGTAASRFDISRFGMELFRASPRQADLMIVSGTVTKKMIPQIVRLYNQMPEPKYVIAMGACATSGGPFKEGYNVVAGVDKYVPVDVYIAGCPPTPQALLYGILLLHKKIDSQHISQTPWYAGRELPEYPVPVLGPDLVDIRRLDDIKAAAVEFEAQKAAEELEAQEAAEELVTEAVESTITAGQGDGE